MSEELEWSHFIKTMTAALGVEKEELRPDTNLYDDIGIDSLGIFTLGMKLTDTYGIKPPISVVATIQTVQDLYNTMDNHRNNKD
ncbi:MAG: phosphopantetheine-binding protein [Chitinispirillia bacterium]|jgi:acyl carrier protein